MTDATISTGPHSSARGEIERMYLRGGAPWAMVKLGGGKRAIGPVIEDLRCCAHVDDQDHDMTPLTRRRDSHEEWAEVIRRN